MSFAIKIKPECPVFGECGGCQYQDLPYAEELRLKEGGLKNALQGALSIPENCFENICPSPQIYHYRHRLDLKLKRTGPQDVAVGFSSESNSMVPIDACPIALKAVSDFLPELKRQANTIMPQNYPLANLVVRCGDEGKVYWGGIGKRSLRQEPQDYMWADVEGKKIFYSLDTFFQANLSILPKIVNRIKKFSLLNPQGVFFDLYGGVGLFGICLANLAKEVVLIEESKPSVVAARFNVDHHQLRNVTILHGRVEDHLPKALADYPAETKIAFVDPPRSGLSAAVRSLLSENDKIKHLFYLSCSPESLIEDLKAFVKHGWQFSRICPFDFFPRTKHLETLVLLSRPK